MKRIITLAFVSFCIMAPLSAGGEKEKPFSLEEFVKKNKEKKRAYEQHQREAYEQRQRDIQTQPILTSHRSAKAILKSFHEKYAQEIKNLLQDHNETTHNMNLEAARQHTPEESIADFLSALSSKKRHQTKRAPKNLTDVEKKELTFASLQQPQGVPTAYNSTRPDDYRFLYCFNEVCLADTSK